MAVPIFGATAMSATHRKHLDAQDIMCAGSAAAKPDVAAAFQCGRCLPAWEGRGLAYRPCAAYAASLPPPELTRRPPRRRGAARTSS